MMPLRPYQSEAVNAALSWVRKCTDPCLIEAVTAAGKSLIAAKIAQSISAMSGKKVLCIAPARELVQQNAEKVRAYGEPCSIYCNALGEKSLKHNIVIGTPQSINNAKSKFSNGFAAVIIDEAHYAINGMVKGIIDFMREKNPLLRVIGMTSTPFTTGGGYIFRHWPDGTTNADELARDPFFHTCVYRITGNDLLDQGFITPLVFSEHAEGYDTSKLKKKSNGQWDPASEREVFVGRGRKTSGIVADVVARSEGRNGIMIFAATREHAQEVMESLPPSISAMVDGETPKEERARILRAAKDKRIRYLVNVATLTTGVDITHIDVIALLRASESPGLLLQIVGRGLRLDDSKDDCLLLDYGENIERHFPNGDIFNPEIKARYASKGEGMDVTCPLCDHTNQFGARRNDEGYEIDSEGYFTDLAGNRIEIAEGQYYPAHYGRSCQGEALVGGRHIKCSHKWSFKECHECGHENDVAARYCSGCKTEIIDPNEKLKEMAAKIANDPYRTRFAAVTGWMFREHISKSGQAMVAVEYHIEESPHKLVDYIAPEHPQKFMRDKSLHWCNTVIGPELGQDFMGRRVINSKHILEARERAQMPRQVCFKKKAGSKFFEIKGVDL